MNRKIKRCLAAMLTLLMLLSLAACGKEQKSADAGYYIMTSLTTAGETFDVEDFKAAGLYGEAFIELREDQTGTIRLGFDEETHEFTWKPGVCTTPDGEKVKYTLEGDELTISEDGETIMVFTRIEKSDGGEDDSAEEEIITIGKCTAKFKGYRLTRDDEGRDAMVLTYDYTNGEKEEKSFFWAFFYNPAAGISAKGGKPAKVKDALTDEQVEILLDTVRELPPYVFIMIGLYAGLRREEILGLQWDCVFLDVPTPYISVKRAWRSEKNRPVISTVLKTKAAKRDIPIPQRLVDCLREVKAATISDYVIADSKGEPLSYSQFHRVWQYVVVRSTKERVYYKYVNGQGIRCPVKPTLGGHQKNNPKLVYSIDFEVTPHQLRHTYITNLLYAGVDPKTVQYLAGHENSKTTMDIYAKVKYNKPEELVSVVNAAFSQ